jgi:hypothetical protein
MSGQPVRVTKSVGHQDGTANRRDSTNRGVLPKNLHGGPTMRLVKEEKLLEVNPVIDPSQSGAALPRPPEASPEKPKPRLIFRLQSGGSVRIYIDDGVRP